MDNQSAQKVIAAIERLSNRIAKLDETSVESAAIASEGRRTRLRDDAPRAKERRVASDARCSRSEAPVREKRRGLQSRL